MTKYTVTITLIEGEKTYTATDGEDKAGTRAFQAFMKQKTVKVDDAGKEVLIPYHSILKVEVTKTPEEAEVEDEFCKKEE